MFSIKILMKDIPYLEIEFLDNFNVTKSDDKVIF